MEEALLSKKELLDLTGISYGQLYRWKRKNLIPEDWFIRKSTFTGQETFFPKERILQRVEQIKNMKEGLSLDALADMFSPNPSDISLSQAELLTRNIVTKSALDLFLSRRPGTKHFSFEQLLELYLVDTVLKSGDISRDEAGLILETMEAHYTKFQNGHAALIFARKLGVSVCALHAVGGELYFDSGLKRVLEIDIAQCVEDLKLRLV